MKKIVALVMIATALFAGGYTGFMKLQPGAWAKYILRTPHGEMTMIHKYLGTIEYKGKKLNVVETEIEAMGMKSVTQYWSAIDNDEVVERMIMLTPQGVICAEKEMAANALGQTGPSYNTTTPKEYAPHDNIKTITYTLKNGKKITAAIFKEGSDEVLVSSEVPFGIVAIKEDGEVVMELVDFGTGAKPAIPPKEVQECMPFMPF